MGSRALERCGHARDRLRRARARPLLAGARDREYGYEQLAADLRPCSTTLGVERARAGRRLDGRAHRRCACALEQPERVAALALITPSYDPARHGASASSSAGTRSRAGCARAGSRASCARMTSASVPERWRATVETVLRQRLAAHEHPQAVADALEVVPRSRPFEQIGELAGDRRADGRRRQPRRGRPRPSAGRRRALRARDPGGAARGRGRRAAAALADRLAGRAALGRRCCAELAATRAAGAYVIAYGRMPAYAQWDGASYDRISGPMEAHGPGRARAAGAARRRDACSTPAAARAAITEALLERLPRGQRDRRGRVAVDDRGRPRAALRRGLRDASS